MTSVGWFAAAFLFGAPHIASGLTPAPAGAGDNSGARRWVQLFEARYRPAKTLEATFLERFVETGHTVRAESGTAYFRRPGKMRWEYESPERDVFLVDGKTAWFYVPADHTVMRVPAKQSTDWRTPLALLAGEMKVSRVCARVELASEEKAESERNVVLRCELRGAAPPEGAQAAGLRLDSGDPHAGAGAGKDESRETVFFEIDSETGELARLLVRQGGGVQVEFRFAHWRMDPVVPDSMFRFEVPGGVAIVNGELPGADASVK